VVFKHTLRYKGKDKGYTRETKIPCQLHISHVPKPLEKVTEKVRGFVFAGMVWN